MTHPQIAQRAFNAPLLVEPRKAAAFLRGLGPRLLGAPIQPMAWMEDEDDAPPRPTCSLLAGDLAAQVVPGHNLSMVEGVAVIPIGGTLIHRGAWIGRSSGQTSYEGIRAQLDAAAASPLVRAIALDIDSFGGEVAGCFGLAKAIRAASARKPVRSFVNEHAFSAAYALAAQGDRIVLPETGGVGSIGVVCMHIDVSAALEEAGVAVTLIHAGSHKVDGNPYQPLPEAVRDEWGSEMEALRQLFARTVAGGRGGRLHAAAALATEARCLTGEDAVAAGLADAVAEPREALAEFIAELSRPRTSTIGGLAMTDRPRAAEEDEEKTAPPAPQKPDEKDDDEEDEAAAGTAADTGEDDEDAEEGGSAASAGAERRRIAAILDAPEAVGREGLARHLALSTSMGPKAAIAVLKASPAAASGGRLAQAMRGAEQAAVAVPGAGGGAPAARAAELMRARFK